VRKYTATDEDIDSVIDVRAVFQQGHRDIAIAAMPDFLLPRKGRYGVRDYEKMFSPDLKSGRDIFTMRGVDRENGCMVVVRPDQFVAHVLPLDGTAQLTAYFDGFMLAAERAVTAAAAE
jgi:phenol 2-monooxygenase (NADPH)